MADALKAPSGTNAREWDGIWNARARQSEIGWMLEIDLPFRSLAFDPNAPAWGINFQRTVRRKQEELLWTGYQRNQGLQRMANAGLLVGPQGREPRARLRAAALLSGHVAEAPGRVSELGDDKADVDVGLDMAYNLTPSLRGGGHHQHRLRRDRGRSAAGQPDPVPAVPARTPHLLPRRGDLLRLPLRQLLLAPHRARRRPAAADRRRRQAERPGRQERHRRALRPHRRGRRSVPGESFLVGRWRRRMLQQSYFGAFYTGRDTHADLAGPAQQTAGADFRLATATLPRQQEPAPCPATGWRTRPATASATARPSAAGSNT